MPPDFISFHKSLSAEVQSVKDRIRNLVDHWLTDGEHKEIVLQTILRRHIGQSFVVGKGFIVDRDESSGQIDLMVIDGTSPTLFRDGDFFITTPDAVRAVIEVKTSCTGPAEIGEATAQLRERITPWDGIERKQIWTGLFVYDRDANGNTMKNHLKALAIGEGRELCPVNCVSAGPNDFIRWWPRIEAPAFEGARQRVWRSYEIQDLAPAYFIGNLIEHLSAMPDGRPARLRHGSAWFPVKREHGKERYARLEIAPDENEPRQATRPDRLEDLEAEAEVGMTPAAVEPALQDEDDAE